MSTNHIYVDIIDFFSAPRRLFVRNLEITNINVKHIEVFTFPGGTSTVASGRIRSP